jgi:hypothetical protein
MTKVSSFTNPIQPQSALCQSALLWIGLPKGSDPQSDPPLDQVAERTCDRLDRIEHRPVTQIKSLAACDNKNPDVRQRLRHVELEPLRRAIATLPTLGTAA